jgi:hypothetical protein
VDFYLTSLPTFIGTPDNEISLTHRMPLQDLDLVVVLLDEEDKTCSNPSYAGDHNKRGDGGRV